MYEAKLISPEGEVCDIPYYEIGKYLEKVVKDYVNDNEDNKELFDLFKMEYSHFKPYLDFAITVLGYKIENPLMFEKSILYGKNGQLINEIKKETNNIEIYDRITDENYHIDSIDIDNLKDMIISPKGLKFEVDRTIERNHEQIYEIILIQSMIYDQLLYNDYVKCFSNPDYYKDITTNINTYFRRRLGYGQLVIYDNNTGYILYEKALSIGILNNLITKIREKYPKIEPLKTDLSEFLSNDEIENAIRLKEEVGEFYESRRL